MGCSSAEGGTTTLHTYVCTVSFHIRIVNITQTAIKEGFNVHRVSYRMRYIHTYVRTSYKGAYVCAYVRTYKGTYVCAYVRTYVQRCICMYMLYVCTYICPQDRHSWVHALAVVLPPSVRMYVCMHVWAHQHLACPAYSTSCSYLHSLPLLWLPCTQHLVHLSTLQVQYIRTYVQCG